MTKREVARLLRQKSGALLDISWGGEPQPNSVRLGPGGDIDHSPLAIPFPLPKASVHTCVITHVLEYLDPAQWFAWWDELHRIMRPHGLVYVSGPYGGDESQGWVSDPTHRIRVVEQSMTWLDPRTPMYLEHRALGRTPPKPWLPQALARVPGPNSTISYNFVLASRPA